MTAPPLTVPSPAAPRAGAADDVAGDRASDDRRVAAPDGVAA